MTLPAFKLVFRETWKFRCDSISGGEGFTVLRTAVAIAIAGLLLETMTLTSTFEIIFWWCMGCATGLECRHQMSAIRIVV